MCKSSASLGFPTHTLGDDDIGLRRCDIFNIVLWTPFLSALNSEYDASFGRRGRVC